MAQTGDVEYGQLDDDWSLAGSGGSDQPDLPAEFSQTAFDRGLVGMAKSSNPNSANSQFFIMFEDYHSLNGKYSVVGEVTSGLVPLTFRSHNSFMRPFARKPRGFYRLAMNGDGAGYKTR